MRRGWRVRPSGRKVGRRQAEGAPAGPGLPGAGALAHLLVPRPGPRDGRLRLGADSARRGARGTGRRLSGPGGAIPASHGRRRRLGSAAPLGLRGSAGGAGSGWGRGRGRAPPGLGLGLGAPGWLRPRATRPGLRTWRSARSEGEPLGARRGAHPHADPGGRPAADRRPRGHGQAHADAGTRWGARSPTRGRFATCSHPRGRGRAHGGTHRRVHTGIATDLGTLRGILSPLDRDVP